MSSLIPQRIQYLESTLYIHLKTLFLKPLACSHACFFLLCVRFWSFIFFVFFCSLFCSCLPLNWRPMLTCLSLCLCFDHLYLSAFFVSFLGFFLFWCGGLCSPARGSCPSVVPLSRPASHWPLPPPLRFPHQFGLSRAQASIPGCPPIPPPRSTMTKNLLLVRLTLSPLAYIDLPLCPLPWGNLTILWYLIK